MTICLYLHRKQKKHFRFGYKDSQKMEYRITFSISKNNVYHKNNDVNQCF